jgi:thiamine biosynthesis lipoprotein
MPDQRRMRALMGTYVECGAGGMRADAAIDAAFAALALAQTRWSFQDPGSELSRLNGARGSALPLCPATLRLLRAARALMQASDGAFDCTVGGTLVAAGALPRHTDDAYLPRGNAGDIVLGRGWASLQRPVLLTLDGIAKGYAVDLAVGAMRRAGAAHGWINAGGDVRVFGDLALPMQRREADGSMTPLGALRNGAMATSRAGVPDPDFPAHIVGPSTPGVWTVVARSAWRADALTKVAATAAPAQRAQRIAALGGALVQPFPEPLQ